MKKAIYMLSILLLLSQTAFSAYSSRKPSKNQEIEDCKTSQERYLILKDNKVTCDKKYLLFEAKNVKKRKPETVKVSAFNILRTGTLQTRFKNFQYLAKMMNRWDLVAAIELMPTPQSRLRYNKQIDKVRLEMNKNKKHYSKKQWSKYLIELDESYEKPGYMKILEALRQYDSSWSLVMSPQATGEKAGSKELSGYYYRASKVTNTGTGLCNNKRGCLLPVSDKLQNLISRVPFMAHFKSGNLDFNAVSVHLRFREPDEDIKYTSMEKKFITEFQGVNNLKEKFRFIELAIINDSMKKDANDFMILGDFNLDYDETAPRDRQNVEFWKLALNDNDQKVLIQEKTSISEQNGLSNSYDHFVIETHPRSSLSKCQTSTAKAYNFLIGNGGPTPKELADFGRFLKTRKNNKKLLAEKYEKYLSQQKILNSCDISGCTTEARHGSSKIKSNISQYRKRVLNKSVQYEGETKHFPFRVHTEILSDHLPIEMTCSTE